MASTTPLPSTQPLLIHKYKPRTLDAFFGGGGGGDAAASSAQHPTRAVIQLFLEMNDLNLLFHGSACSGKTTLLDIMIREYYGLSQGNPLPEANILYINSLKEQGIGYFRGDMKTFCQASCTIFGKKKMVIIDDLDTVQEQSQQVFRNYIDKYSHNIHFVSVCTNLQKVIESFQSRVHVVRIDPPSRAQLQALYREIVVQERLRIDADAERFLFQYYGLVGENGRGTTTTRALLNHLEKCVLLGGHPIGLDVCMRLCTDVSFQEFERYVAYLREGDVVAAIRVLYDIYDYGYSVVDIYDFLFRFVKVTLLLTEEEKYRMIPPLCQAIAVFHRVHENEVELALFTAKVAKVLLPISQEPSSV